MKTVRNLMVIIGVVFSTLAYSQNVSLTGNTFSIIPSEHSINAKQLDVYKTKFNFKGDNGDIYDIYISSLGECVYFKNVGGHSARKRVPSEIEKQVQKEYSINPNTKKYWCVLISDENSHLYAFKIKGAFTKNTICKDYKPTSFFVDIISIHHKDLKNNKSLKVVFVDTFDNIKEL